MDGEENVYTLRVLELWQAFSHTLPEWPVFCVDLRLMKFKVLDDDNCYHGFVKDDPGLLCLNTPFDINISDSLDCSFVKPEVEEFRGNVDIEKMKLLPGGVLIVWKWNEHACDVEDNTGTVSEDATNGACANDTVDTINIPYHTVTFKCIGTTKETTYQETLSRLSGLSNLDHIEVNIVKEPTNPVDSKAIAFTVTIEGKQHPIGYAVREVLGELHDTLNKKEVVDVRLAWVKYIVQWSKSGPGYYCGINVTKKGEWSQNIIRYQSTRTK